MPVAPMNAICIREYVMAKMRFKLLIADSAARQSWTNTPLTRTPRTPDTPVVLPGPVQVLRDKRWRTREQVACWRVRPDRRQYRPRDFNWLRISERAIWRWLDNDAQQQSAGNKKHCGQVYRKGHSLFGVSFLQGRPD